LEMGPVVRIRTRYVNARKIDAHRRYLLHWRSISGGDARPCSIQHRKCDSQRDSPG
jgi:hypothetical protein